MELIRRIPWARLQELEKLSDDQMIGALVRLRVPELLVIGLCAGVGEELLLRGWLMGWLRDGLNDLASPLMRLGLRSSFPHLFRLLSPDYQNLYCSRGFDGFLRLLLIC